jgi:hypothetical protein
MYETYPMTRYNPVHGAVTVDSAEEANKVFMPEHNWFATPQEADAHRHQGEAGHVVYATEAAKLAALKDMDKGVVAHSVMHTEAVDRGAEQAEHAMDQGQPIPVGSNGEVES